MVNIFAELSITVYRRYREHPTPRASSISLLMFAFVKIMLFLFSAAYLSKKFNQRLLLAFVRCINILTFKL